MTSHSIPRAATTAVAGAVLLGAAFWLGSYSGREASAATTTSTTTSAAASPSPGITVTGTGTVSGTPDTLRLDLSITTRADSVGRALADASGTMARVRKSLKASGVGAKDLQTSNLSISPDYAYPSDDSPRITGYTVSQGVSVTLRDFSKAGQTITDATRAGGNAVQVGGIRLDLADTSTLVTAARDRAVANARTKAEQYARATGRKLGQVLSLSEAVSEPPSVMLPRAAAADKGVPIEPGSQDVDVSVTVVYAFG